MEESLSVLINKAKHVFQTDGLYHLLIKSTSFLISCFFVFRVFYLYRNIFKKEQLDQFVPPIQNLTLKTVFTNQQADELLANGFEDVRLYCAAARNRLDKEVVAFCVFAGRELAYLHWLALNEEAKKTITSSHFRIDFSNREVYAGDTVTIARYRRKGLNSYVYYKEVQFLRKRGVAAYRAAVQKGNIAACRTQDKLGSRIYAEAWYVKVLWWTFWKERRLTEIPQVS